MGNTISINKINFQDMQKIIVNPDYIIINTLSDTNQDCLILNTLYPNEEIIKITEFLTKDKNKHIVIYGENCNDSKLLDKYNQLVKLGFNNIYVYIGGLFEWLLLQDIYGEETFPTTKKELDLLKYKPDPLF